VKLLLDQHLSRRVLPMLEPLFPGSNHVQLLGMATATDANIWWFAKASGFSIVTKDSDFVEMSVLYGHPPKVIWLNVGNVSNKVVQATLLDCTDLIKTFLEHTEDGVLEIE
jgi:predicted nuclease of predicted toxin-antitoxin system